jgi:hypothetical protein
MSSPLGKKTPWLPVEREARTDHFPVGIANLTNLLARFQALILSQCYGLARAGLCSRPRPDLKILE